MKKGLSEIVIVLDRSGSMKTIRKDMIGGINTFIQEQKKTGVNCKVSHYQFDSNGGDIVQPLFEQLDLNLVKDLTENEFQPRGGTPLYDASAIVIRKVGDRLANTPESERPEKVLVVFITDGEENESRDWTAEQVKQMIEHQTEKYKWEFVYIGANQDAWNAGSSIGVKSGSTLGYVASAAGTNVMFRSLSSKTSKYLCSAAPDEEFAFDAGDLKDQTDLGYKP